MSDKISNSNYDDVTMPGRNAASGSASFDDQTLKGIPAIPPRKESVPDLLLGRYRVIKELGRGGMGVVYRCKDEVGKIEVAVKTLPPELSHNPSEMEDILDNFQLVSKLVHQNIAISKNLEQDPTSGTYYLIMECVNGIDLKHWLREKRKEKGRVTLEEALPILRQIAGALDFAHGEKVIHRDIKPGNVMIDADGKVKVLDFGLAAQFHSSMSHMSMAYTGTSGTAPYMAPEQWEGQPQGAASDQYALAVTAYEMLSGRLPFDAPDSFVLHEAVLRGTPKRPENISGSAWYALQRGLSKKPAERFASCEDFVNALAGEKVHGGKNSNNWTLIVIAVAALLLAGGAWRAYQKSAQKAKAELVKPATPAPLPPVVKEPEKVVAPSPTPGVSESEKTLNPALKSPTPAPKPGVSQEELEEKVYTLQSAVQTKKQQIVQASYDRGQTFGEHLDTLEQKYNSAEKVMTDGNNSQRFSRAKQWYSEALKECEWILANAPLRQAAIQVFSTVAITRQKAVDEGAEKLGRVKFREGDRALAEAKAAFEAGKFQEAKIKGEKAAEAFKKAFDTALAINVKNLLDTCRIVCKNGKWDRVIEVANQVLAKDANNAEAQKLKAKAEKQLKPWLKIAVMADGKRVYPAVNFNPQFKSRGENGYELAKGRDYQLSVKYENNGETWVGTKQVSADWGGTREVTIDLEKVRFTGTVTLPGNIALEMVKVEAGRFQMGSTKFSSETPHWVTLTKDYWIGKYEVTQEQYQAIMGTNPSYNNKGGKYPVETVKWYDAIEFCQKLNQQLRREGKLPVGYEFNLPTEAQWEYAARGGKKSQGYVYSGSNNCGDVAWYDANSGKTTHPVGQVKQSNELGIYDMSGNVWEWCRDCCEYQSGVKTDTYVNNVVDPMCTKGSYRVGRGGGWCGDAVGCRVADRYDFVSSFSYSFLGFRLVLAPVQ